ncbi:heat shock factor 2-binding protein-like isoform X2 [Halichondria panicea]|uniref:heat shock factor 2-binding protein-like isoform X2 n=1 Tax=Halichondria panicea TaxID=6063 RepID=UPI00312B9CBF
MAACVDTNAVEFQQLVALVGQVKQNLCELGTEWRQLQQDMSITPDQPTVQIGSTVVVSKAELDSLATETMMLKEFLPKVLNPDYLSTFSQLSHVEQELCSVLEEREGLVTHCEQLERRTEAVLTDYEQEKKDKFAAKCEAMELSQQLSQQADYCSSLGSACCTLLWRVSRHEDCIHSILSGSKVSEFLELVSSTLQSFLAAYTEDLPSEESDEAQFILALCGIVTNIAASAYGRDYLSESGNGRVLIDMLCSVLSTAPNTQPCSKMKGLILMALYNISINQKGLQYLTSKDELMKVLAWMLQGGMDSTNKLHCLKLLQSLILEPQSSEVVHQALEAVPMQLLQKLSSDINTEVQEAALELMSDLSSLQNTPH